MRGEPSANLVSLLARLKLATAEQVAGVASRVRRLAGDLGDFESVWVDALAQSRILTPYQAAQINAGQSDHLLHGPYVITHALGQPHFAACFAARHVESHSPVRLYVVRRSQVAAATTVRALGQLIETLAPLRGTTQAVIDDAGLSGDGAWAACPAIDGVTAADWMVENGRFAPQVVLHIARAMVQRLRELEDFEVVHGDLSAAGLLLQKSGHIVLPMPGLRGIVRPHEGYSFAELQPEAYDYLAPERIAGGSPPSSASDFYAAGCLWWHLLTGRPPFAGGNSLAKLKAVHAARTVDVRQLAPVVPEVLAHAIQICLARDPADRPQSAAQLSELLGPPTRAGVQALVGCLRHQTPLWHGSQRARRRGRHRQSQVALGLATVSILILIGLWPVWRSGHAPRPHEDAATVLQSTSPATSAARPSQNTASNSAQTAAEIESVHLDPAVTPTAATLPNTNLPADMILPADKALRLSELDLQTAQHVRGRPGERPLVSVPAEGLVVAREDVSFEGIDFIWEAGSADAPDQGAAAMLVIAAQTVEFRGCSFSSAAERPPAAIAWIGAEVDSPAAGGEVSLADCVFSGLAAVVDCPSGGGLSVELNNSLCVASGPIVRLHRAPQAEQSITISLTHATTRGDSAVLECRYARLDERPGMITVTASDSALDGNPRGGLLILVGSERPDRLLSAINWSGSGSMVTERTAVAVWRGGKRQQVLPEDELEVAGLVRGQVEFAGAADGPPSASRVVRWQVPLRSTDPPGADTNALYLPR